MQTHINNSTQHEKNGSINLCQPSYHLETYTNEFTTNRSEHVAQRRIQKIATTSITDSPSQPLQLLANDYISNPVQMIRDKSGLNADEYRSKLRSTVILYAEVDGEPVGIDGVFMSSGGNHAEDNLIAQLETSGITSGDLIIWLSTSPCSSDFGTKKDDCSEGCQEKLERLHNPPTFNVEVRADHLYQPKELAMVEREEGFQTGFSSASAAHTSRFPLSVTRQPRWTEDSLESTNENVAQLQSLANHFVQNQGANVQRKKNNTGLPDSLKSGIENLSGLSMDDVKVHYNSNRPAQLQAHAFAQGNDIHLATGQEKHLPHEAWHVVQQKQGRVKPTFQMRNKVNVNDDEGLEREADVMGAKAASHPFELKTKTTRSTEGMHSSTIQRHVWIIEKGDRSGDYPVLLMFDGALGILERYGYELSDAEQAKLRILLDDHVQRYYSESEIGVERLYNDIVGVDLELDHGELMHVEDLRTEDLPAESKPIATCSFHYRYHANRGKGALKYDPLNCSKRESMDFATIDAIHRARGGDQEVHFEFTTEIAPRSRAFGRKMMAVPSVGCPSYLRDIEAVLHLQWAQDAENRPVVLFVPLVELGAYKSLASVLAKIGVGLVAWSSREGVAGFGASRLAAQKYVEYAKEVQRHEVVLCDVNVAAAPEVFDGYDTGDDDDEGDRSIRSVVGPGKYSAAGFGTGIPTHAYDSEEDSLQPVRGVKRGGDTRPIEQVVTVGDRIHYDPAFITSSEDADMTNALLAQETPLHTEKISSATFKYPEALISKADMGFESLSNHAYMAERDRLLHQLHHEDHVLIRYKGRVTPIGDVALAFAKDYRLNAAVIRSLIIEKIILEAKRRRRLVRDGGIGSRAGSTASEGISVSESGASSRSGIRYGLLAERRRIETEVGNFILNPDATISDGNCLFETVIQLGAQGDRDIAGLRRAAREGGARAEIETPGEWANIEDIRCLAERLGVRFVAVALDLHYNPMQITPVGRRGELYYIAQIFGGHFVPLHRTR